MGSWDPDDLPDLEESLLSGVQASVREDPIERDESDQGQELENELFGSVAENTQEIQQEVEPSPLRDSVSDNSSMRHEEMPNTEFPFRAVLRANFVYSKRVFPRDSSFF